MRPPNQLPLAARCRPPSTRACSYLLSHLITQTAFNTRLLASWEALEMLYTPSESMIRSVSQSVSEPSWEALEMLYTPSESMSPKMESARPLNMERARVRRSGRGRGCRAPNSEVESTRMEVNGVRLIWESSRRDWRAP